MGVPPQAIDKFEEYKLFVQDTARFSERRQTISNIYIAVNTLLLAAIGLLIKDVGAKGIWLRILPLPLIVAGISACSWWRQLIRKYKALVGLRIDKLREIEAGLPGSIQMYHAEDELYPRDANGRSIDGAGLNIADLESKLPRLFMALYVIFGLLSIVLMIF